MSAMSLDPSLESELLEAVNQFKATAGLSKDELQDFQFTKLEDVQAAMITLQQRQSQSRKLRFMRRLSPFLETIEEYGKVIDIFVQTPDVLAFVWGPMKYVLTVASTLSEAFSSLLGVYADIGEQMPLLSSYQSLFSDNPHMRTLLVMIFQDILLLHREALKFFKQRLWKQFFQATWKGFVSKVQGLKDSLRRHRQLIESRATIVEIEEIRSLRRTTEAKLDNLQKADMARRKAAVFRWLSSADTEVVHERHLKARSNNPNAGQWLLDDHRFQKWFDPVYCSTPLLWMNGKPDAGKTVLTSRVVDEARKIAGISVAFFYCAENDPTRDNFAAVARAILSQLLAQDDNLLLVLDEKMSAGGEAILSSSRLAKDLLQLALKSRKTFIVIDGIDECPRDHRREICTFFRNVVDSLPKTTMDEIRCLFVSQDDGIARKDLSMLPTIKITADCNRQEIAAFAKIWQIRIEERFGTFSEQELDIAAVVTARSQGMFIFAKCVLEELFQQPSRGALLEEWKTDSFPSELDDVYRRITRRILQSGPESNRRISKKLMSWISCSKRPLYWHEIQCAISVDLDNQKLSKDKRLINNSKDFCASMVEVHADYVVELVHPTAKDFLVREKIIDTGEANRELFTLSIAYLCFPEISPKSSDPETEEALVAGVFAFYEYAVATWTLHLLDWLPTAKNEQILDLSEDIEAFIDLHSTNVSSVQVISKPMQDKLKALQILDVYGSLAQVIIWQRKCLTIDSKELHQLLDFPQVTTNIRAATERTVNSNCDAETQRKIELYYGTKHFKCSRLYCQYFYQGFQTREERNKHCDRHDRAFICTFEGCPTAIFGCASRSDLAKHLLEFHGIQDGKDEFPNPPEPKPETNSASLGGFQCNLCPKRFTRAYNLRSHLRSHTDERPFVCTVCGKSFARQTDRKRHESLHDSEKKFVCKGDLKAGGQWGCGRSFSRADALDGHFESEAGRICIKPLRDEEETRQQAASSNERATARIAGSHPGYVVNFDIGANGFSDVARNSAGSMDPLLHIAQYPHFDSNDIVQK